MALFAKRIDIDTASIRQLVALYEDASQYVRHIIFEVGSRSITITSVRQARFLIRQRLAELARQSQDWSAVQMAAMYDRGQQDAVAELRSFNDPRTDAIAAAILLGSSRLGALHQEAVDSQTLELQTRLADATANMARTADKTLNQLLSQSIRARVSDVEATGTRQELRQSVLKAFDENGVYGLVDASGKRWSPSVYADMVANTLSAQTRNSALTNSLSSQGYDLVRVSSHGASDVCGQFEGAILSLTGSTPGFLTVGDAAASGLFHPHCRHGLDPVDPAEYPADYFPDSGSSSKMAA